MSPRAMIPAADILARLASNLSGPPCINFCRVSYGQIGDQKKVSCTFRRPISPVTITTSLDEVGGWLFQIRSWDLLLIDAKLEGAIDAAHLKAAVQNLSSYGYCIIGELDASQLDQVASHLQASKISFLVIKGKDTRARAPAF